ncbi:hypothetical protein MHBO_000792 [Bonamia ostreae]|uniref:Uncharacterized protein n=1 Tax=Bonamia ostreae TaxID=126728 RepID=A0ABV2AH22_9EUKA
MCQIRKKDIFQRNLSNFIYAKCTKTKINFDIPVKNIKYIFNKDVDILLLDQIPQITSLYKDEILDIIKNTFLKFEKFRTNELKPLTMYKISDYFPRILENESFNKDLILYVISEKMRQHPKIQLIGKNQFRIKDANEILITNLFAESASKSAMKSNIKIREKIAEFRKNSFRDYSNLVKFCRSNHIKTPEFFIDLMHKLAITDQFYGQKRNLNLAAKYFSISASDNLSKCAVVNKCVNFLEKMGIFEKYENLSYLNYPFLKMPDKIESMDLGFEQINLRRYDRY